MMKSLAAALVVISLCLLGVTIYAQPYNPPSGGGSGCTVGGSSGDIQYNNGSSGCDGSPATTDSDGNINLNGMTVSGNSSVSLSHLGAIEYENPNMRFSLPSTEEYLWYNQGRGTNLLMSLTDSSGALLTVNSVELSGTTGSTQCIQANSSGVLAGAGYANCVPLHPGYITGSSYWYAAVMPGAGATTGAVTVASSVYCTPMYITTPVTIKAIGVLVDTADSGGHVGFAVYTNGANFRPGTLVDYAAPASTTTATEVSGAMNNTTDTLSPAIYWFCASQDNTTSAIEAVYETGTGANPSWAIGSATQSHVALNEVTGVSCAVSSSTCGSGGSGWSAWSSGSFGWGSFSGTTWSDLYDVTTAPFLEFEVN